MAQVTLEEAFRKAAYSYYNNEDYFKNTDEKGKKPVRYTLNFFDDQEKHIRKLNKKSLPKAKELIDEVATPEDDEDGND